jgi:hypothetical protein
MTKAPHPPLPSTVAEVFANFFKRLETDGKTNAEIVERLRQTLHENKFDPESLRAALFDPVTPPKS